MLLLILNCLQHAPLLRYWTQLFLIWGPKTTYLELRRHSWHNTNDMQIHSVTPEVVQQGSWESREYTCVVLRKRDSDSPGQKANIWGSLVLKVDHSDYDGSKYGWSLTDESIQLWRDDMIDSKAINFFNMTDMVFCHFIDATWSKQCANLTKIN